MLRPSKHSHPDQTVINVSKVILERLLVRRVEEYDNLRKHLKKVVPKGDALFVPALSFLFLLGVVEYRPKTDAFEYVGPNETL